MEEKGQTKKTMKDYNKHIKKTSNAQFGDIEFVKQNALGPGTPAKDEYRLEVKYNGQTYFAILNLKKE